jgi:hypothetical protein
MRRGFRRGQFAADGPARMRHFAEHDLYVAGRASRAPIGIAIPLIE